LGTRSQWVPGAGCWAPLFQRWAPPYFCGLRPLGKMTILASLIVKSS